MTANPAKMILAILVLFPMIALNYMVGDLWYDELITIYDFAAKSSWQEVVFTYSAPNNHILFTLLLRAWMAATGSSTHELVIRLPSLCIAVGTLVVTYRGCRRLYPERPAELLVLIVALSPVFLNYCWQVRGYGLSMLLSAAAAVGCLLVARGRLQTGLWLYVPAAVLLPAVMPSNVLLNVSLLIYLVVVCRRNGQRIPARVWLLLTSAGIAGMALYLPVWRELCEHSVGNKGFYLPTVVVTHWVIAAIVHVGVIAVAFRTVGRRLYIASPDSEPESRANDSPVIFILACLAPILVFTTVFNPFSRVFLSYLVPVTIIIAPLVLPLRHNVGRRLPALTLVILLNSGGWQVASGNITEKQLTSGRFPHNLLCQFYSRRQDVSQIVSRLNNDPKVSAATRFFIDFRLFPALHHYSAISRQNLKRLECMGGNPVAPLKLPAASYRTVSQIIITYNAEYGKRNYTHTTGLDCDLIPMYDDGRLKAYRVADPR